MNDEKNNDPAQLTRVGIWLTNGEIAKARILRDEPKAATACAQIVRRAISRVKTCVAGGPATAEPGPATAEPGTASEAHE